MLKTTSSSSPWTDLSNNLTFSQVSISCDSPLKSYLMAIGQTVPGYFVLSKNHTIFPLLLSSLNFIFTTKDWLLRYVRGGDTYKPDSAYKQKTFTSMFF
jgi:hypothetical protein